MITLTYIIGQRSVIKFRLRNGDNFIPLAGKTVKFTGKKCADNTPLSYTLPTSSTNEISFDLSSIGTITSPVKWKGRFTVDGETSVPILIRIKT